MPEIQIRPAVAADLAAFANLEHGYQTHYVWQMDRSSEEGQITVAFREVRLPRPVEVEYPRLVELGAIDAGGRTMLLAATQGERQVGYISLADNKAPLSTWVTDLVVAERMRRKGIASALLLAAHEWAAQRGQRRMILEMQSKNYPAIQLAGKMGYEFCGYNDHYYTNQDIALFFACYLR